MFTGAASRSPCSLFLPSPAHCYPGTDYRVYHVSGEVSYGYVKLAELAFELADQPIFVIDEHTTGLTGEPIYL